MKAKNFSLIPSAATTVAPILPAVTGDMSANITSNPVALDLYQGAAVHAIWTGTPTGTLKLQASNFPKPTSTQWVDLPSPQALAGAAGNYMWNLFDEYYNQLRLVYLFTSGTGTLIAQVNAKAFGA